MQKGWLRNQSKWTEFLGELSFLNWRSAPLLPNREATVPSKTGVYALMISISKIARLDDQKAPWNKIYGPMYIGKAGDLNQRFSQHASTRERNTGNLVRSFVPLDFWWAECDENQYEIVEAKLIALFGPSFNTVQPLVGQLGEIQKIR